MVSFRGSLTSVLVPVARVVSAPAYGGYEKVVAGLNRHRSRVPVPGELRTVLAPHLASEFDWDRRPRRRPRGHAHRPAPRPGT